jgi:5-methylcytosine-specific restriction endonuclease McrA
MKRQHVLVEEPHVQSMAALVLLCTEYMKEELAEWLNFRHEFFDKQIKVHGSLKCHYCGKDHLVEETTVLSKLATVDHVKPVSKGGARYDEDNCVVACFNCNHRKGNKELLTF